MTKWKGLLRLSLRVQQTEPLHKLPCAPINFLTFAIATHNYGNL